MSGTSRDGAWRRGRLAESRLYFVWTPTPGDRGIPVVAAALEGGADIVQLRAEERGDDSEVRFLAPEIRRLCDSHDALFVVNDRPDLAQELGADGVHVGQEDMDPDDVRSHVGEDLLIGLSTHSSEQVDAAGDAPVDHISVGPVWETPTKPGRPATGLELLAHADSHSQMPWFAIGGINVDNIGEVLSAGAERIVVVRAIRDAADPKEAAKMLVTALDLARVPG